jgi:hypothetical protein
VSVASGAVAHVSVVFDEAPESSVVIAEVSVASGAEVSVAGAEVSVASGAVVHAPVVSAVPGVSVVESDDGARAAETGGEGFSARAVAANRDA